MSSSDFILLTLLLAFTAFVLWALDINPYTNKLQAYQQECDNMILDNSYCKGKWQDLPITQYTVNELAQQVIYQQSNDTSLKSYEGCSIVDRKNWTCPIDRENSSIAVSDGMIQFGENSSVRQITRLEWLQNRFLEYIN